MDIVKTYLDSLQGKIYKLLPMREDYDNDADNHLPAYSLNLFNTAASQIAFSDYLSNDKMFAEILYGLSVLRDVTIPFDTWRSTVLRSTRIAGELADEYSARTGGRSGD